jgi:isoquinoline 1-oxidoreductase subunit beta
MKRRTFVLGGLGAGGALLLGWGLLPPRQRLRGKVPLPTGGGEVAFNGYVKIGPGDTVTVVVPKAEMGQGIFTAAAMLLAEELDCAWTQVRVEFAPVDAIYNNIATMVDGLPFHPDDNGRVKRTARWIVAKYMREFGFNVTGGSSSVTDLWDPMRDAGAMARLALASAAAKQWDVPVTSVQVADGKVSLGERSLGFGALAAQAAANLPGTWERKDITRWRLIGRPMARLDAGLKATGTAVFGLDAAPKESKYAAVVLPPSLGATIASFDASAAKAMPGVRAVVQCPGSAFGNPPAIAVVADTWWHASQAAAAVKITWTPGAGATFSSASALANLEARVARGDGRTFADRGDLVAGFKAAAFSVEGAYRVPYLAHAPMEPMNCTVRVSDGTVDVWCGTQVPGVATSAAAAACGVEPSAVRLHQQLLGGSFGRRQVADYVAMAGEIARQVPGTAVQLIWSREQDLRYSKFRPMVHAKLQAALDGDGKMLALNVASAGQAQVQGWGRWIQNSALVRVPDKTTVEGFTDQPYEWPALRVVHDSADFPVPVGLWRSVGHSYTGFMLESFVDECAAVKQTDPVAYRDAMLREHPRARAVLNTVAEQSQWGTPIAAPVAGGRAGRGVALHWSFQAYVAHVAEVEISPDNRLRVRRVVVAVDCGQVVNPDGVRQQMESGVIFGLSAALYGEVSFTNGQAVPSNFHEYPILTMTETPVIEVHMVSSDAPPGGVGEVAVPGIAAAVGNAIFAAGAGRLRALPFRLAAGATS